MANHPTDIILNFQKKLAANNNREWFQEHKKDYKQSEDAFKQFVALLEAALMEHDHIDPSRTKRFRIYRDIRFSSDKTPYNKHRSVSFGRATEALRGGYYLRIEPGDKSFLAGGFWQPEPADLLHIRKQLQQESEELRSILQAPEYQSYFGELKGDKVKTAPKGFTSDDPAIDLLRHKGFILTHEFTDKEVREENFHLTVNEGFKKLRPFFNFMSDILTTDLNGQTILKS